MVSDHACCRHETKAAKHALGNIWLAKSGFGARSICWPRCPRDKAGLSLNRVAALTSGNPAKRFGLNSKGDIAPGLDADLALVDPKHMDDPRKDSNPQGLYAVRGHRALREGEGHVPARQLICENGNVLGKPKGRYMHRPTHEP